MAANPLYTLSPLEKQLFNGLSQRVDRTVLLGDRLQAILTILEKPTVKEPTPVDATVAKEPSTLDGAVKKKTP